MDKYINKIIQGDCLEVMKDLPDNSVDAVITDPPYGIGEARGGNKSRGKLAISKDYGNEDWDNERVGKQYIDEIRRVSKEQVIFGGNYYADLLPPSSCWIVWDKDNGKTDFADSELAWTSYSSAVRNIKYKWQGMLQGNMKHKEKRYHPTQKPLPVMRWIIERYTKEGDIILDPFCGSGTTCLASKQLGRNYIGIDISEKYCKITGERLHQEVMDL